MKPNLKKKEDKSIVVNRPSVPTPQKDEEVKIIRNPANDVMGEDDRKALEIKDTH